jgi:hypothetical protein
MSANGSNARLDRIERLIEQTELANKKAHEENRKAHERMDAEMRQYELANKKNHERMDAEMRQSELKNKRNRERMDAQMRQYELEETRHRQRMDTDIRRTRLDQRRWAAFGVKDDRCHRKKMLEIDEKIALIASAQLVNKEMLRQITSGRGQNGAKH